MNDVTEIDIGPLGLGFLVLWVYHLSATQAQVLTRSAECESDTGHAFLLARTVRNWRVTSS